ncbi:unnamed protein product, partial [Nesidiocoris tenuis]
MLEQIDAKDKLEPESEVDVPKDLKKLDQLKTEVKPLTAGETTGRVDETEEQDETEMDEEYTKTTLSQIPVEKKIESVTDDTKPFDTEISNVIEVETRSKVLEHEPDDSKEPLPLEKSKIPEDTIQPAKDAENLTLDEAAKDKELMLEQIETKDKLERESKVDVPKDLKKQDPLKLEVKPQSKEERMARKDETEVQDQAALDEEPTKTTISSIQ